MSNYQLITKRLQDNWCATKVDENQNYVTGFWGDCGPDCSTHKETMKNQWQRDENFTMTLQYDNTALWSGGLELYGKLLAGILVCGLSLTTLLPALGKI